MKWPRVSETLSSAAFDLTQVDYPAGFSMGLHAHRGAYLTFVSSGGYLEQAGSRWRRRRAGEAIYRPAGELHACRFSDGDARCLRLRLAAAAVTANPELAAISQSFGLRRGRARRHGEGLVEELHSASRASPERLAECVAGLLRETVGACVPAASRSTWIDALRARLDEALPERLPLQELARWSGVHVAHLARAFRRAEGCSIGDYVRRSRVREAQRRLVETDESLSLIAHGCGFADQSHLTRVFRELTGTTPACYRRSRRPGVPPGKKRRPF